jgi:hypothetical protein
MLHIVIEQLGHQQESLVLTKLPDLLQCGTGPTPMRNDVRELCQDLSLNPHKPYLDIHEHTFKL